MLRRNFITDRPYPTRDALLNFRLHASEITYFLILKHLHSCLYFFFFNDPATPEISPLPLHAALPISRSRRRPRASTHRRRPRPSRGGRSRRWQPRPPRSPRCLPRRPRVARPAYCRRQMMLHVHEWGDPAAPPLVCVHGVTGHGERFKRLAEERWGARFRVVAPDLRGHGRSGYEPPWTFSTLTADLVETLSALEIGRASCRERV